jgi:hypothetical protein
MAFEEFIIKGSTIRDAAIGIERSGKMNINTRCYQKYFKGFDYVVLFFDREKKMVGLKPTKVPTKNTYAIKLNKGLTLGSINARTFLKHFEIDHKEAKKYQANWDDVNQFVVIDLS